MSVSLRSDKSSIQPARDAPSFQAQHLIKINHVKLRIDLGRFRSEWRAGEKAGASSSATWSSASCAKSSLSPHTTISSRMTRREKSKTSFGGRCEIRSDQIGQTKLTLDFAQATRIPLSLSPYPQHSLPRQLSSAGSFATRTSRNITSTQQTGCLPSSLTSPYTSSLR